MNIPRSKIAHKFSAFKSARGARIFQLPLEAFPGFWVYAYLVMTDGYRVLIDTGSGLGKSNDHLEAGFVRASNELETPVGFKDLTHILITHGHIDHFGGLVELQKKTSAKIGVHELDVRNLTNYEERIAIIGRRLETFLVEAGVEEKKAAEMLSMYRLQKSLFQSVPVDFTYQSMNMEVGPFKILHVPGHCAGHVAIRLHNILFTGDHVLESISPHQSPERLTLNTGLGHYIESLDRLLNWSEGVTLTLGGHNDPIFDLPARINAIRIVHSERLHQILGLMEGPRTIAETSGDLFGDVNGYNILLAIEETGAHVEYLYQLGLLNIVNTDELEGILHPVSIRYKRMKDPVGRILL